MDSVLADILSHLKPEHAAALEWFADHENVVGPRPWRKDGESIVPGVGFPVVAQRGIHQPRDWSCAISITATSNGAYLDGRPTPLGTARGCCLTALMREATVAGLPHPGTRLSFRTCSSAFRLGSSFPQRAVATSISGSHWSRTSTRIKVHSSCAAPSEEPKTRDSGRAMRPSVGNPSSWRQRVVKNQAISSQPSCVGEALKISSERNFLRPTIIDVPLPTTPPIRPCRLHTSWPTAGSRANK